jgi:hypothetical protein
MIRRRHPIARRTRLRRVSVRRSAELREYHRRLPGWKREHPHCCVADCGRKTHDCHHQRGRILGLLLDERYWLPVCRAHHDLAKDKPTDARALGLLPPVGQWNTRPKEEVCQ